MAAVVRETGATGLPLAKKSVEWTLLAVISGMGVLAVVGLETASANMLQRNFFVVFILMGLLLGTIFLVEPNTNVMFLHVGFRDSFDVTSLSTASSFTSTVACTPALLLKTRRG